MSTASKLRILNSCSYRNYEWFWIPVIAPHVGGIIGAWIYRFLIEMPSESQARTLIERGKL